MALHINLDDVATEDAELAEAIVGNTRRYQALFAEVVEELIQAKLEGKDPPVKDALDAFIYQRLLMAREAAARATRDGEPAPSDVTLPFLLSPLLLPLPSPCSGVEADLRRRYPPQLMRRFEVYFAPRSDWKGSSVRDIKAAHIGKLITLRGLVIRATEVSPQASVITYTCDTCGAETYQPVRLLLPLPPLDHSS